ncbi:MAG: hypothetical protein AAF600_20510 [Bacteroidota bacterium]
MFTNLSDFIIGLTTCALVLLYVKHETSFDSYHDDVERKFRVIGMDATEVWFSQLAVPYSDWLLENSVAGVEKVVRSSRAPSSFVKYEDTKIPIDKLIVTEPGYLCFLICLATKLFPGVPQNFLKKTTA